MLHDEWFELISAAVDGELDAVGEEQLASHLATCAPCTDLRAELDAQHRRLRIHAPVDHGELVGAVLSARSGDHRDAAHARSVLVRRGGVAVAAIAAALVGLVLVTSRATPPLSPAAADQVFIAARNQSFDHPDIEVAAGTTVEWRNDGATKHHLVRRLGAAVVGEDLAPGQIETATFAQAGTFEFFCTIHPEMSGTVTVDA